jgi:hypothetical protein
VADDDETYSNVRDPGMLGPLIGQRVIEITQHDAEEFDLYGESRIYLHFDNGMTLSFPIGDAGFTIGEP